MPTPPTSPRPSAPASGPARLPSPAADLGEVEVRRSSRRRRTVSAYRAGGRTVVLIPASFGVRQEREWVAVMLRRLESRELRRRPSDEDLLARAQQLARRYLGGRAEPSTVRWVTNQRTRWGSCSPRDRSVRISDRVRGMPGWVQDYVLLHELAHLLEPGHGAPFWTMLEAYPHTERARGYLLGVAHAAGLDLAGSDPDTGGSPDPATA